MFIFGEREDASDFLERLQKVCGSHGWRVHAWVLMGNHFHLLLETPEPNLVSGMQLLMGTFGRSWNRRRGRRGHVFQGRYKSIPVSGELASDESQFGVVADYIHLNPARAGLAGGAKGKLVDYEWSSLSCYAKGRSPDWLVRERVMAAFKLAKSGRGRRAYIVYLEERASENGGKFSTEAMKALQKGWYLGDDSFRDRLLEMIGKSSKQLRRKANHEPAAVKSYGEVEAARLVGFAFEKLDFALEETARKGDPRKVAIASLLKEQTNVSNQWITERLQMGHNRSVSRLVREGMKNKEIRKLKSELEKMLPREG